MLLDVLAPALRDAGHVVTDVCADPDALAGLVARRRPDACLVEVSYRGTTRLDALAATRVCAPETLIVALTGEPGPAVWRARDDGVLDGVVSKSGSFDDVLTALRPVPSLDLV
jgi:DNA-binding NarL/FixJ family response regulator